MSSRNLWPGILAALCLAAAAAPALAEEPGPSQDAPAAPQAAQTQPAPGEPQGPPPNLRIVVEGNRRWCVRTREPVWPNKTLPQLPLRRRRPMVTTLAYAHYVFALPESEALEVAAATGSQTAPAERREPGTSPQTGEAGALPQTQEAGAPPRTQVAAGGAAGAPTAEGSPGPGLGQSGEPAGEAENEEETLGATVQFAAPLPPAGSMVESPPDTDLAKRPGTIVITQSPVYRTMTGRRVQVAGKPPEVKPFWDAGKSCCQFPSVVQTYLPPGRYIVQVNFDVFMRRKGWQHVQMSRRDGVEIKEGEITELTLRVDTDGYVEVKPSGRVVDFLPAGPSPAPSPAPAPGGAR